MRSFTEYLEEEVTTLEEAVKKDEVGTFYVVFKPTQKSDNVGTIVYALTVMDLLEGSKFGFRKKNDVVGIYKSESKAKSEAKKLLK